MRQPATDQSTARPIGLPEHIPALRPRRRRGRLIVVPPPPPRGRRSERGERMLTVAPMSAGEEQQPMIRIRGRWLARLGFAIGARITVTEERDRLVLTIEGEE